MDIEQLFYVRNGVRKMNETVRRFLVCPYTRKEIVVAPRNHKVFCPECKMYHLLPDGVSRSMKKLKEVIMCEESW